MDESFNFFRRNFGLPWPAIRKRGAKCRWEKFRQISVKIGEKIAEKRLQERNRRNLQKYAGRCNFIAENRFVSPIFREISRYFLPVQPAHNIQNHSNLFFIMICKQGCVFQPGSKIVDLEFVKFKSNGTKAKRP